MTCSSCRHRDAHWPYKSCDECRDKARRRYVRSRNPGGRRPGVASEQDQQALPDDPNTATPGRMHSCAICGEYGKCHLTQLELGGPTFYVCVACNTEDVVPRDIKRAYRDDDDSDLGGDLRAMVSRAYERIVPKHQRGLWLLPFGRGTDE